MGHRINTIRSRFQSGATMTAEAQARALATRRTVEPARDIRAMTARTGRDSGRRRRCVGGDKSKNAPPVESPKQMIGARDAEGRR